MKNIILIFSLFLLCGNFGFTQTGEELFLKNCFACHTIGSGKRVGPDLKGVEERRSIEWIGKFILSSVQPNSQSSLII